MQIERLRDDQLSVVNGNNGLHLYLNKLLEGRPHTPRSWLYEQESDTEVLQKWLSELKKVEGTPHGKLVYQFDISQMSKWGPQGGIKPIKELMDLLKEGFMSVPNATPAVFRSQTWQRAKYEARNYLTNLTGWMALTPRSYAKVVDDMRSRDTLESNSGWPLFTRRKLKKVVAQSIKDATTGKWKEYPAIVLFRDYRQKTRPVWMYPMSTNIVEGSFSQPLKEAIINHRVSGSLFFAPWRGYEHVLTYLTRIYESNKYISASDFSHTDAHFTKWVMLEVYDVIKYCFQRQYWDALKESMLRVCSIPLVFSPDSMLTGDHGVSSGSNWTNDCETYLDLIAEYYMIDLGIVSRLNNAIGDDVAHTTDKFDPNLADKLATEYRKMGFDVNAEKVTNSEDHVKYLQRLTIRGYYSDRDLLTEAKGPFLRGIYSTVRALNSLLWPEKFHSPKKWNKRMFAARTFMILENCIDHPLFKEFVAFVIKGNPYLRKFARKSAKELDDITRESRLVPGLNTTYNQEKRDQSLAKFDAIRIARNL